MPSKALSMLGKITYLLIFTALFCQLYGQRVYVAKGGTGSGASWQDATGDLNAALRSAGFGTEIWVAAGTYYPTANHDRDAHFSIPDGVVLYGGFKGTETDLSFRNWQANPTFLSGEIGSSAPTDNSYTVIYTKGVSAATVIDGFVITGGMANGVGEKGHKSVSGGAWYNDGTSKPSTPEIRNCVFSNNYGREGAAIFNNGKNGNVMALLQNCTFADNIADLDGGAIYNESSGGNAYLFLHDCSFQGNEASYGAGIFNSNKEGVGKVLVKNCDFTNNLSYIRGSSIYETGKFSATVENSVFHNNQSSFGMEEAPATPVVTEEKAKGAGNFIVKSAGS